MTLYQCTGEVWVAERVYLGIRPQKLITWSTRQCQHKQHDSSRCWQHERQKEANRQDWDMPYECDHQAIYQ